AHASSLGLEYRVWSSAKVDWNLQRNLQFLDDYLRCDSGSTAGPVNAAVKTIIEAEPGISLLDLLVKIHGVVEPDVIYSLIASGEVYVNLSKVVLAEPAHVRLFANARVAAEYREISRELEEGGASAGRISSPPAEMSDCWRKQETKGTEPVVFPKSRAICSFSLSKTNMKISAKRRRLHRGQR